MDTLLQDLRVAFRTLRRNPAYAAVALLTLGLGIGANTAVFSMVNAVLIRPLPFPDADRIVVLWGTQGAGRQQLLVSAADVQDWRTQTRALDAISMVRMQSVNLTGSAAPDRLVGSFVEGNFFNVLGARTALGRVFTMAESDPASAQAVAVLSHSAWRTRFGGDSSIVGRTLTLQGRPYVIVGITAPDFQDPWRSTDVWLPLGTAPASWFTRGVTNVWAVARTKPGVTREAAEQDLRSIQARLAQAYPAAANTGIMPVVVPVRENIAGKTGDALLVLLAFVGVLLLIVCTNVANLQMARAAARTRELSLRSALGAGRGRLARQLLTESTVLAVLGGATGVALAIWTTQALVGVTPGGLPALGSVRIDRMVLMFAVAVTLATGALFGLAPALRAARWDLAAAMNDRHAGGGPARTGLRNLLVGTQLALCITLLVGAGLLLRSLSALQRVNIGFTPDHVLSAEFRLPAVKYDTAPKIEAFMQSAIAAVRQVPGVQSAALVRSVPLSGNFGFINYDVEGQPRPAGTQSLSALENDVTPGFFRTMQTPVLAGRDFTDNDRGDAQVVIVNDVLARRTWPGESPLGKRLNLLGPPDQWATVIGVVGSIKQRTVGEGDELQIYRPIAQQPYLFSSIVARTAGDAAALAPAVRAAIWSVDPNQPVWRMVPLTTHFDQQLATPTFTMVLTTVCALLALVLASVGVYGVMAYMTELRTREVGIRMALGAAAHQIVTLFLRRASPVIAGGAAVGLLGAVGCAMLLRSRNQLFGVATLDLTTFVAVPVLLVAVAVAACYGPARRASRLNPSVTLRSD